MAKAQDADKKDKKKAVRARELLIGGPGGLVPIMDRMEQVLTAIEKNAKGFAGSQAEFDKLSLGIMRIELERMATAIEVESK